MELGMCYCLISEKLLMLLKSREKCVNGEGTKALREQLEGSERHQRQEEGGRREKWRSLRPFLSQLPIWAIRRPQSHLA